MEQRELLTLSQCIEIAEILDGIFPYGYDEQCPMMFVTINLHNKYPAAVDWYRSRKSAQTTRQLEE